MNGKINIIESYSQQNRTTREITEAIVIFQSSRTAKENQAFYEKWGKDNKWQVSTSEQNRIVQIILIKDKELLTLTLEKDLFYNTTTKVGMVYRSTFNFDEKKLKEALNNFKL